MNSYGKIDPVTGNVIELENPSKISIEKTILEPVTIVVTENNKSKYTAEIEAARQLALSEPPVVTYDENGEVISAIIPAEDPEWLPPTVTVEREVTRSYIVFNPQPELLREEGWYPIRYINDTGTSEVVNDVLNVYLGPQENKNYTTDSIEYHKLVESLIRTRYSVSDELGVIRQKDQKPDEFQEYFEFCEECKETAKTRLNIV